MNTFETDNFSRDYKELLAWICDAGNEVSPRGLPTFEIENAVIRITDPSTTQPIGQNRGYSPGILAAEMLQWLSGTSDLVQLNAVSKDRFLNYSDDGVVLYGAYGPRAYATLNRAARILKKDPDSRQAVAVLWDGREVDETKDLPCTLSWGFRLRDGKLKMTTTMRSNDAWRGMAYDLTCMTRIGSAMAWALGVEFDEYTHVAYSLHVYHSDHDAISALTPVDSNAQQPPMLDGGEVSDIDRWLYMRLQALSALDGPHPDLPESFAWYAEKLKGTPRGARMCVRCRYFVDDLKYCACL